jgi:hypothetical protein
MRDFVNCKKLVAAQARFSDALLADESKPFANVVAMLQPSARSSLGA